MQVWNTPLVQSDGATDAFALSAHDLLRHYARRQKYDSDTLAALKLSCNDLSELFAKGLLARAAEQPEGQLYGFLVRSLPDLWWIDYSMRVRTLPVIADSLNTPVLDALWEDSLKLISHVDQSKPPHVWESAAAIFSTLVALPTEAEEKLVAKCQVLARGLALTMTLGPDRLRAILDWIERDCSRNMLRALMSDEMLLNNDTWISALMLRGGKRCMALGAASLLRASHYVLTRIRNMFSVAPKPTLIRLAEAHGLLSLAEQQGQEPAEVLRTAFLTQAWQREDFSDIKWWQAFRGEQLVTRSLAEVGDTAMAASQSVLKGLIHLLDQPELGDDARSRDIAECLAWTIKEKPGYCSAMRLAEARLRDIGAWSGSTGLADSLRNYARVLIQAARILVAEINTRDGAIKLYARVLRLRKNYPDVMPKALFPNSLEEALTIPDPERAARRWMHHEAAEQRGVEAPRIMAIEDEPRPSHDDPLPTFDGAVTTVEGLAPLPASLGRWVGATTSSTPSLIDILFPAPLKHLLTTMRRTFGASDRATFSLTDDGKASVSVRQRLLGFTARTQQRTLPDGQVFTFPVADDKPDKLLGRWTALILCCSTVGFFLLLNGAQTGDVFPLITGSLTVLLGLLGYAGALSLHRILQPGLAVAVRDDNGGVTVWQVDEETRHLLAQPPADVQPQ